MTTNEAAGGVPTAQPMPDKSTPVVVIPPTAAANLAELRREEATEKAAAEAVIRNKADNEDQRFLNQQIAAIEDGIEAVQDIARNWTDLRNLSRLHPGVSAQEYILSRVKHPLGREVIVPLLAESNWSNRQIAEIAGVSPDTVDRTARNQAVDRPAETLGADGKLRPARVPSRTIPKRPPPAYRTAERLLAYIAQTFTRRYMDAGTAEQLIEALIANLGSLALTQPLGPRGPNLELEIAAALRALAAQATAYADRINRTPVMVAEAEAAKDVTPPDLNTVES